VIPPDRARDTAAWLRTHTTLTERVYPTLGHSIDPIEIVEAASFIATQVARHRTLKNR
jgi:hypothetical protein